MVQSDAISRLRGFEPALRAMGASGAFLFGSTARGERHVDSDIDVLLDVPGSLRFTLIDLAAARRLLAEGLQTEVDVAIRADLSPNTVHRIMGDAIRIF